MLPFQIGQTGKPKRENTPRPKPIKTNSTVQCQAWHSPDMVLGDEAPDVLGSPTPMALTASATWPVWADSAHCMLPWSHCPHFLAFLRFPDLHDSLALSHSFMSCPLRGQWTQSLYILFASQTQMPSL
jgi:hypothetical protein